MVLVNWELLVAGFLIGFPLWLIGNRLFYIGWQLFMWRNLSETMMTKLTRKLEDLK